ncbi:MAG: hypothetical protein GY851_01945, partial [bacterium]|nr:hypothetical protein [bacterium]
MVAEGTLFYRVDDTGETHWHDLALRDATEEFQLLLPADGQIVASASGEVLPTIEIHDPAGELVASSVEGYVAYAATSPSIYSVSVVAGSKWTGYEFSVLSELPQAGETVDLGVVDHEEVLDALGGNGAREFTLEAARDGYLTVLAHKEEVSEDLTVTLLDQDGGVVAAASAVDSSGAWEHEWRLDHVVTGGEAYRVLVMGDGEVDLRICNLVRQAGDAVEVFDTEGDDGYLFTVSDTFNVTANGVEYEFDDATEFALHSSGGLDVIEMVDSDGDDTLNVSPDQVVMSGATLGGTAYSVMANGFHAAHGYAKNGGNDAAEFVGGEKGERAKAYAGLVKMMGGAYFARAKFFERVDVEMGGGVDTAVVVPSEGADVVWASLLEVRVAHDVDGAEGVASEIAAAGADVAIDGAERIVARARGGDDWLELHDSVLNDVFIAKPNKVEMMNGPGDVFERGELYRIVARGFRHVSAIADRGGDGDVAKLYDSGEEGVDVWAAGYLDGETWSTMASPSRLLYEVLAFEHVGGYGFNGGLGEEHGTNRREHGDDVDFVFKYGYWEGDEEPGV